MPAYTRPNRTPTFARRPHGLLAVAGLALAGLAAPVVAPPRLRLIWNVSASVPLGLYRIEPAAHLRAGDLAALRPPPALARFMAARRYVEANALLLKPVAAVPCAAVCREANLITIDGAPRAAALGEDRSGRPLPSWSGCRRLEPGELFLLAPSSLDSFDSRYFGPVRISHVVGRAVPLWTW